MKQNEWTKDGALKQKLISTRRTIHQHPNLSCHEEPTAAFIAKRLEELEIPCEVLLDGCSVVGTLQGKGDGPVVGLRADIDALPIQEETGLEFASQNPGVMHACGHDAHTTILLGAAEVLSGMRNELNGTVKFFFQPAEESIGGAQRMIEAGCLENPHVDYVLGLHINPVFEVGQVGLRRGKMYAASDMFDIVIRGKGAHGAHPDEGLDTIVVAANIVSALQSVISRRVSPFESAIVTIGKIQGGTVRNQIADRTELNGIIRTLDLKQRAFVTGRVREIAESVGKGLDASVEVNMIPSYGPTINDDAVFDVVADVAQRVVGEENVFYEDRPELGTEDFAYFTLERPSCFFHLGCRTPGTEKQVDLHNSRFTIDEDCLMVGVALQVENTLALLRHKKGE